jgi:hypothetical protein
MEQNEGLEVLAGVYPPRPQPGPISSPGSTWMSTANWKHGFHQGNQPLAALSSRMSPPSRSVR